MWYTVPGNVPQISTPFWKSWKYLCFRCVKNTCELLSQIKQQDRKLLAEYESIHQKQAFELKMLSIIRKHNWQLRKLIKKKKKPSSKKRRARKNKQENHWVQFSICLIWNCFFGSLIQFGVPKPNRLQKWTRTVKLVNASKSKWENQSMHWMQLFHAFWTFVYWPLECSLKWNKRTRAQLHVIT